MMAMRGATRLTTTVVVLSGGLVAGSTLVWMKGSDDVATDPCPIVVPETVASPTIVLIDSTGTVDPEVLGVASQYSADRNGRQTSSHATAMAALVFACAPNTNLISITTGGDEVQFGADAAISLRSAIDFDPDVILLGFGTPVDSEGLRAAVAAAEANDVLVVAPAGNTRAPSAVLGDRQGVPLRYWNEPIYPAAYETVLAVGALDADELSSADFSQDLPYVDVAAPGTSLFLSGELFAELELTGTSYAAPQVAAVAAIARWLAPDLSSEEVRRLVVATARPLDQRDTAAVAGFVQPLGLLESLVSDGKP